MDYLGKKCPVCDKYFHAYDDIVVCPECGAPHHRECFEKENNCFYKDRHSEDFAYWDEDEPQPQDNFIICKKCNKRNPNGAFFCSYCKNPLNEPENQQENTQIPFMNSAFDPMGGVEADALLSANVTAGEVSKYVKQNTPYFIRIFYNIKNFAVSRFNFCAALFTGGYLLYRKQYLLGSVITALMLSINIINSLIFSSDIYMEFVNRVYTDGTYASAFEYLSQLSYSQSVILMLPGIFLIIKIAVAIVLGCIENRLYFKHCIKKVSKIKSECKDNQTVAEKLQIEGGVNYPLAISIFVTYMIIDYLPMFFK